MKLLLGRLGGALVIAGSVAFLIITALVLGHQPVGTGLPSIGGTVFDLGLVLAGTGTALLAAAGQGLLAAFGTRLGLAILATGILTILASSIVIRVGVQSYQLLILLDVGGIATAVLGWLVTGIALQRRGGVARLVGRALIGGVALVPVVVILANLGATGLRFSTLLPPVVGAATVLILGGMGGLGYLALSDRWSWR